MKKKLISIGVYLLSLALLSGEESRMVGDFFIVGSTEQKGINAANGLSPDGCLAVVVPSDENGGIPNPKGEPGVGIPVSLVEVNSGKVLWSLIVDGDFSWGPLTSMVTAYWNPQRAWQRWEPEGSVLRINMGRMMSETRLFLLTEDGSWREAKVIESDFQKSVYFQEAYAEALRLGNEWYDKRQPPNHHVPGCRHFGDWIGRDKIMVHEACIGDLIYRYDSKAQLYLVGFDPNEPLDNQ